MRIDFTGQRVLVTGGTRGIGRAIAHQCTELGGEVVVTGTRPDGARDLPGGARYHAVDFADPLSLEAFLAELERYDRLDVCVNNAGINRIGPVDETRPEDWAAVEAVNLSAPYRITQVASRTMKRHRYGRIVNIGSIFGVQSRAGRALYSMTKFGIRGLTLASALDLAQYNVLVNTVSPGFVDTDLTRRILGEAEMARLAGQVPLGRFAGVEEIAKVVLFLASRENTYITAQNIVVDGGFVNA